MDGSSCLDVFQVGRNVGFIRLTYLAIGVLVGFSGCTPVASARQMRFQSVDHATSLNDPLDLAPTIRRASFMTTTQEITDTRRSPTVETTVGDLPDVFVPTYQSPVFRLRNLCLEASEFLGPVLPDWHVTRIWTFEDFPSGRIRWEQVEYNRRELREHFYRPAWEFTGDLLSDNKFFYSRPSMAKLGGMFTLAAVFANTSIDENFQDWLQQQGATAPNVDCWFREFGNGSYLLAAITASSIVARSSQAMHGNRPANDALDSWSNRTLRSYVVGGPTLLGLQYITGASRPGESSDGSEWHPFNDNNGASGHTFVGALPFLVAAKMAQRPVVKAAFFTGSGLAGYGRLCDDGHYLSQVMLGWMVAYLAVEATTQTDCEPMRYRLVPLNPRGFYGLGVEIRR